jgi:hypothetical protein
MVGCTDAISAYGPVNEHQVESPVDVKTAVANAKQWLVNVMQEEGIANVGLEEVEFDEERGLWLITLGFSRPWNSVKNAFTAISGDPAASRAYRVIAVKEPDGEVVSMKRRETVD